MSQTSTHPRASTTTTAIGGIGKRSHLPALATIFNNTDGIINKQTSKLKASEQLRSDLHWFIKIENKAKSSHQYNRSYTLNCKRTTTIR